MSNACGMYYYARCSTAIQFLQGQCFYINHYGNLQVAGDTRRDLTGTMVAQPVLLRAEPMRS